MDWTWMAVLIAYIVYVNWYPISFGELLGLLIQVVIGMLPVVLLAFRNRFAIFALPFITVGCGQISYSLCDTGSDPQGVLHFAHEHVFPTFFYYSILRLILLLFAETIWKEIP
ncbi:MAG: hypothetical protein K8R88_09870 [Armatimonadetes bacterium]|nr:hypothetical protein [Armatimonadota bacterium]